ncbi:MAG: DUF480 domain-containing protein [Acidimicrobiales bacterium]
MLLSLEQGRVVGCLVEKQLTTPQQYPLTLNALVLACNQTSNRDPVVSYSEPGVQGVLASLKELALVRFVYPSSGRSATRYRQVIGDVLGLDTGGLAVLAVLLLRGPQTAGELRARTERMASLDGLGAVNGVLDELARRNEPLVVELTRRPGQKEERWAQLLTPDTPTDVVTRAARPDRSAWGQAHEFAGGPEDLDAAEASTDHGSRLGALADEVAALRAEIAELRGLVDKLRTDEATEVNHAVPNR